jgi:hypothetical protein
VLVFSLAQGQGDGGQGSAADLTACGWQDPVNSSCTVHRRGLVKESALVGRQAVNYVLVCM